MMKRFLPTILLLVVCIVGFWYASNHNFFQKPKDKPTQLITLKKEDAQSITITNHEAGSDGAEVIELKKTDDKWAITQPAAYPLNTYSADSWVEALGKTTSDKKIEDNASADTLKKYGLDNPKQIFEAVLKDGSKKTLLVGDESPVPGMHFVKTGDSNAVYQESDDQITPLKKNPFDFIEKSAFQFEYNKLDNLTVEWKGKSWTLTKSEPAKMGYESKWKLGDLELAPDDGSSFLDKLINMSTNEMIKPQSEYKLDNPELKVTMVVEDKDGKGVTSTYVGKINGNDVIIALQGGQWAYKLPLSSIQELYDKAQDTRDKVAQQAKQQAQTQQNPAQQGTAPANGAK